jgi:hypothetical protein
MTVASDKSANFSSATFKNPLSRYSGKLKAEFLEMERSVDGMKLKRRNAV